MNYADENGFVYGKVKKTKDGTYHVLYLSPKGYFNPCESLGEYATKGIAESKLEQYHEHMTIARKCSIQVIEEDCNRMTFLYTAMIALIVIALISVGIFLWSCA